MLRSRFSSHQFHGNHSLRLPLHLLVVPLDSPTGSWKFSCSKRYRIRKESCGKLYITLIVYLSDNSCFRVNNTSQSQIQERDLHHFVLLHLVPRASVCNLFVIHRHLKSTQNFQNLRFALYYSWRWRDELEVSSIQSGVVYAYHDLHQLLSKSLRFMDGSLLN